MTTKRKVPAHVELPLPRNAQTRACLGCGLVVLVGLDGHKPMGKVVTADVWPLSAPLERAAVLMGRTTHRVWRAPGGGRLLHRREQCALGRRGTPAGGRAVVVAEHVCGQPLRASETSVLDSERALAPFWGGGGEGVPDPPPW